MIFNRIAVSAPLPGALARPQRRPKGSRWERTRRKYWPSVDVAERATANTTGGFLAPEKAHETRAKTARMVALIAVLLASIALFIGARW